MIRPKELVTVRSHSRNGTAQYFLGPYIEPFRSSRFLQFLAVCPHVTDVFFSSFDAGGPTKECLVQGYKWFILKLIMQLRLATECM
jgi:hypothetical protein